LGGGNTTADLPSLPLNDNAKVVERPSANPLGQRNTRCRSQMPHTLNTSARNLPNETDKLTTPRNDATWPHPDKLRLTSGVARLESRLRASEHLVAQLQGELQTSKTELTAKGTEFTSLDNEMCSMRKRLNEECTSLTSKCGSLTEKCSRFEEQNGELTQVVEDLRSQLAQKDSGMQPASSSVLCLFFATLLFCPSPLHQS
jgi:chromosome segregation ATPase